MTPATCPHSFRTSDPILQRNRKLHSALGREAPPEAPISARLLPAVRTPCPREPWGDKYYHPHFTNEAHQGRPQTCVPPARSSPPPPWPRPPPAWPSTLWEGRCSERGPLRRPLRSPQGDTGIWTTPPGASPLGAIPEAGPWPRVTPPASTSSPVN